MSQKVSRFKVGVFVLIGVAMMLGSIVGLGTLRYFQPGRSYVTFFNESVQGLQRDSTVKYRGVDVGRVKDIRVGPDYKLIEVVMDIQFHGEPEQDMVAQLKTVGITGIVFVELDLKKPGEPDLSPRITFAAEYPIIPSKPSELTRVLSVIDKVTKEIEQINFKAMADKVESVLDSTNSLVSDNRWKKLLKLLENSTEHLNSLLTKADTAVKKSDLEGILKSTTQALAEANTLLKEAHYELKAMKLPATADKVGNIVDEVGGAGSEILQNMRITSENLQRASETLDQLLMRLRSSPSDLIFSSPPPPRDMETP
jgi:phospholipid/cholesterol/gamma-HCH transport system substrate-binding protein